ncbi:MAG TPA: RNA polymerase sigma factor [Thermoleophilia bacterium]|nr:RNA polymerase sigma factor [Thermoleophilia bacterium]
MDAETSDAELMQRTADGDEPAFRELVDRWRNRIARFLHFCTSNAHDAEELAQDVFVRVHGAAARYTPTAKFSTWLFTIARNLCRNWRRSRWRHDVQPVPLDEVAETLAAMDASPAAALGKAEQQHLIARAISELPERQRAALTLRAYGAMSYDEIAAVLGTSRSAVETLLFRARETMRRKAAAWREKDPDSSASSS